jgi:hypothetical protein
MMILFMHDTLLADLHGQVTYGALWAIKWSAKVTSPGQIIKKNDPVLDADPESIDFGLIVCAA